MNPFVLPDEHVDDLQLDGLAIIQKSFGFKFGVDAVLLADFAKLREGARVAELCSGGGIVSLLAAHHCPNIKIDAVEILPAYADLARRNVAMNALESMISVHCNDLKNVREFLSVGTYDFVLCNPPYKKVEAGMNCPDGDKAAARSEIFATLDDVVGSAAALLKENGKLYMVHRPSRLNDIVISLENHKLAMKRLRTVHSHQGEKPVLILCEALKNGKSEIAIEPPLILFDADGRETEETRKIYRRKS